MATVIIKFEARERESLCFDLIIISLIVCIHILIQQFFNLFGSVRVLFGNTQVQFKVFLIMKLLVTG